MGSVSELHRSVVAEVEKVVIGQKEVLDGAFIALLTEGHALIEGVPGVAKTLLVRALAKTIGADFRRIQFTPDLMPSDVTGSTILHDGQLRFRKGPIFTHLLLGDEINRAPAKTQSALLEAMQERAVTADGERYPLDELFVVFGTQNPIEQEGTYPLPEAELDRFMMKLLVDYPTEEAEREILTQHHGRASRSQLEGVEPVTRSEEVVELRSAVAGMVVSPEMVAYVTDLIRATRTHLSVSVGCVAPGWA